MEDLAPEQPDPRCDVVVPTAAKAGAGSVQHLLQNVDASDPSGSRAKAERAHQNQLVEVRLGLASALFTALRAKHAPSAAHSVRVALTCSAWGMRDQLDDETLDQIEVAALLHDIGKVAVPDHILHSTSKLTADEYAAVDRHRTSGLEILASCCRTQDVLDIVHYSAARFDGSREGFEKQGLDIPFGARMIAIADAFDSMTTDHVYRRALSRERATTELFRGAGTQFDPNLVNSFCELVAADGMKFNRDMAKRWLIDLSPDAGNRHWRLSTGETERFAPSPDLVFHQSLIDQLGDAVIFVDLAKRIVTWNRAAAQLTGIPAEAILQKQWSTQLIGLHDHIDTVIEAAECPVSHTLKTGVNGRARMQLHRRDGEPVSVDTQFNFVTNANGVAHGVAVIIRDATSEIDMQERVQTLANRATRDALTNVANRAEFDSKLDAFVESATQRGSVFSLIMTDIDHFKAVNDTFGHQAGDAALISFADLLSNHHRKGDLVARYGGEEFAVICADCDNSTATARAEAMCNDLSGIMQPALNGQRMTASFGVTEIQAGDTPETILRRADRALMQAKEFGRNMVVQLGSGGGEQPGAESNSGWFSWFKSSKPEQLLTRTLITPVPINIVVEKLRGFVADQHAEITDISEERVSLKLEGHQAPNTRRADDRPVPFLIELGFQNAAEMEADAVGTMIHTVIRPVRHRDRRERNSIERARTIFSSLKSYLMATEFTKTADSQDEDDDPTPETASFLSSLLGRKEA